MLQCPKCNETTQFGIAVGPMICHNCKIPLQTSNNQSAAAIGGDVSVGAKVFVGGNLTNLPTGKIKVFPSGELHVEKELINAGDLLINDPEKIKTLLIESVKTAKSLADLGKTILETFFGR